jgi:hypothetical protein
LVFWTKKNLATLLGGIFAYWRLFTFGQFLKYRSRPLFGGFFFYSNSCLLILTKAWIVLDLGRFCHKLFWSLLPGQLLLNVNFAFFINTVNDINIT